MGAPDLISKAEKNPRRQAAQYHQMVRNHRRLLPALTLFWLLPAVALVVAFLRDWPTGLKVGLGIALGSGVIQHLKVYEQLRDDLRKARELESSARDAGGEDTGAD